MNIRHAVSNAIRAQAIFLLLLVAYSHTARADSDIEFHGSLTVVECSINSNNKETVEFGNVGVHRIDGKRYEQPVPFTLSCKNYAGGDIPALTLMLEATATSFNDAAVKTDATGLGIELRIDGVAQPLNKAVSLDYKSVPVITAVPVADPQTTLSAKPFSATVKLTVEVA